MLSRICWWDFYFCHLMMLNAETCMYYIMVSYMKCSIPYSKNRQGRFIRVTCEGLRLTLLKKDSAVIWYFKTVVGLSQFLKKVTLATKVDLTASIILLEKNLNDRSEYLVCLGIWCANFKFWVFRVPDFIPPYNNVLKEGLI